jgi:tetratricopeptide (TPR) repeat protein
MYSKGAYQGDIRTFGRPEWGPEVLTPWGLRRERDRLLEVVQAQRGEQAAVLVYAFTAEERRSALIVLEAAIPGLRRQTGAGDAGSLRVSLVDGASEWPQFDGRVSTHVVHHASRIPALAEWALSIPPGVLVVATGTVEEWESVGWMEVFPVRAVWHRIEPDVAAGPWLRALGEQKRHLDNADPRAARIFRLVALLDSLGVATPRSLAAAFAGLEEEATADLIAGHRDLFHEVGQRFGESAAYTSKSEAVSDLLVDDLLPRHADRLRLYHEIVGCGLKTPTSGPQRHAVLRFLQGLTNRGQRDLLIELVQDAELRSGLHALWAEGSLHERLAWSKVYTAAYRLDEAVAVLEQGINQGEQGTVLLDALANTYLRLGAQTGGQAGQAHFRRARQYLANLDALLGRRSAQAPQIAKQARVRSLHATARVLAMLGSRDTDAAFEKAHREDEQNIHVLVSWADYHLFAGQWKRAPQIIDTAKGLMERGEPTDARMLFVQHLEGRLTLKRIDFGARDADQPLRAPDAFAKAREKFHAILAVESHNLPALVELGRTSLVRGHWLTAEYWLSRAVRIDPGNIAALMSFGQLEDRRGDRESAEWHYRRVLRFDPGNIRACTAWAAMAIRHSLPDAAERMLLEALSRERNAESVGGDLFDALTDSQNAYTLTIGARLQTLRGQTVQALQLVEQANAAATAERRPPGAPILVEFARARRGLGDQDAVVDALFGQALAQARLAADYEDYVVTRNSWAADLLERGATDRAAQDLSDTLAFDPDNALTKRAMARCFRRQAQLDEAVQYESEAADLENDVRA